MLSRLISTIQAVLAVLLTTAAPLFAAETETAAEVVDVRKIWDAAPHNAFTDLIRFDGRWFCVFREGQAHVSPDGSLRVIVSDDAESWRSAALLSSDTADLRDAKITVTPAGQLMLSGAAALHQPAEHRHQSLAWFSDDGETWSKPMTIGQPDFWLWRVTWHQETAYGIGYATAGEKIARLYRSENGRDFDVLVENLFDVGYPNESSLVFMPDETCYCLLRRDGDPSTAQLGVSRRPYKEWEWKDLGVRIGGPHLIRLPDGRLLAAGRGYEGGAKTKLWSLDPAAAKVTELLTLPSGGDTSYPGLVFHEGQIWMSYYASHEGKTSIYLARIKVSGK